MLIIWNSLFSTLCTKKKDLQIVYGLTKPLNSHSFFRQHFHLPPEIYNELSYTKGVKAKWKVLSGKPDDLDPRFRSILERKLLNVARLYRAIYTCYATVCNCADYFSSILLFIVMLFEHYLARVQLFLLSAFILVSLVNSGAIPDQRRWIF